MHLFHYFAKIRASQCHGNITDFFARALAIHPGDLALLNVGVSTSFVELVIESRDNIFPGPIERDNTVVAF